jgi:precorrin-2 methylase
MDDGAAVRSRGSSHGSSAPDLSPRCADHFAGPLDRSILRDRLAQTDAAVIIKLGRHFEKVRLVLNDLGLTERSLYIERATLPEQQIRAIDQVNPAAVPYWSPILILSRSHPGA